MSNTNMPGVGQNTPVTLSQAQKPRVVVHAHGTTTYSRQSMTASEKTEFSQLRWGAIAGKTLCHDCGRGREVFEGDDPDRHNPLRLCVSCLQDRSLGFMTAYDYKRNRDYVVTGDGVRVVIVDGVIEHIGEAS